MRYCKKYINLLFLFIFLISPLCMGGCTNDSPEGTVKSYFAALKNKDFEAANEYVVDKPENKLTFTADDEKKFMEQIVSKTGYHITDSNINVNKAIVKTKVTAPDLSIIINKMANNLLPDLFAKAANGTIAQEDINTKILNYVTTELSSPGVKYVDNNVEINLSKDTSTKKWLIENDVNLGNAITGNLTKGINDMLSPK